MTGFIPTAGSSMVLVNVSSPEAADLWVECLDEIASNAYDVSISILL